MNLRLKLLNIWNILIGKVKVRVGEAKESRSKAREQRGEFRAAEQKAYYNERIKVAAKEGKIRARQPRGIAGITAGIQTFSKNLNKISPPQKSKGKQPTMMDVLGGTTNKSKGKTMLDVKF